MSKNIEIEAKTLISKDEYELLISSFKNENNKVFKQLNYYFCEKDISPKNSKLALRIRDEGTLIEATLKVELSEGKLEINQRLSKEEYELFLYNKKFPKGEVYDYLKDNKITNPDDLVVFATLTNYRLDVKYKDSLVSIDKSEYLGHIDYEIECEASSMKLAKTLLKEFLANKKIPYKENHISKLKRVKKAI